MTFPIHDLARLKRQLLQWADGFETAVYLDSNEYPGQRYGSWECLVGVGAEAVFQAPAGSAFDGLQEFLDREKGWAFGFFGYDLKNEIEQLGSANPDGPGFPDLFFFRPRIVAGVRHGNLEIYSRNEPVSKVYDFISSCPLNEAAPRQKAPVLVPRILKADYLATVEAIRNHIIEGDVYELNFCQEFYAQEASINPLQTFHRLNVRTRAPFAAYLRMGQRYLLCASPERFLRREGELLISQPIKGTRRRGGSKAEDALISSALAESIKDRAENVMIVDLVRNDLARSCRPGTVRVEELFGIYAFETVFQMISTVSARLRPEVPALEALRLAFPMGSMTGAPKVMAMQLIERYERTRRGLFSGALGYFAPNGDFDFNVVIRSLFYNADTGYLGAQVGGAIVYDSAPEEEYAECLLKAEALFRSLTPS